ncbi:MAG: TVP38/TMEM64 family protein [Deltaproteobacteria bacterium]|nr:TVP38/TMEM64 family protein [Deltaproteobacteria bacterium]
MKKTIGISVFVLLFFGLALYLLIFHSDIYLTFLDRKRLAALVKSYGSFSPLIFVALQIFQVLFAPIPGEVTGFIGGFLYGNFFGVLYSTIGLGLGSWLAFVFARWAGQPLVERIVSYKMIQRFDYLMAHQGTWIAFLLFLVPGFPKDYLCYILGLGHMDLRTFLIISTVGRFLGTLLLTIQGDLVRDKNYLVLGIVIGLSLLGLLIAYLLRGRLETHFKKHRRHGIHFKIKNPKDKG